MAELDQVHHRQDSGEPRVRGPHFLDRKDLDLCSDILEISKDDQPDIAQIASLAGSCTALSHLVIEKVNSASVGLVRPVSSVRQAVVLLGARSMHDVVKDLIESGTTKIADHDIRLDQPD